MSSTPSTSPTPGPSTPPPSKGAEANRSGALSALEYTGIPKSWLKRPKLPSRNWLIFLSVVSTSLYLYWDDRRQCKTIKNEYINRVRHLAQAPLVSWDQPRKVRVYACKWPGDEEYDRSMKYFRKYLKPIFVAAAIDFEMKNGNHHGALADLIKERSKERRLEDLGVFPPLNPLLRPKTDADRRREREGEMEGGTILIGRHTFKEYMQGLKRGWTESLVKVDEDEILARSLQNDGHFDEPDDAHPSDSVEDTFGLETDRNLPSTSLKHMPALPFPPGFRRASPNPRPTGPSSHSTLPSISDRFDATPATIPSQPPLLLVHYPVRLGFRNIPLMIYDFFNERKNMRNGCEAAYRLVIAQTRSFVPPSSADTDLTFDLETEANYGRSYRDTPKIIEDARKGYYSELPAKLKVARTLARNEREPTKDETNYPPPTEVELRAQRLKKEKRWREDENAFVWLKEGADVEWDPRFEGALDIFRDPTEEEVRNVAPIPKDEEWVTEK